MSNIKPLKGLEPVKKYHYLFALDEEDFAYFTGGKGFISRNQKKIAGKNIYSTNKYIYVLCRRPEDIRGYTNIEVSITDKFKENSSFELLERVKKEISICNFKKNKVINEEHIPNILREVMMEHDNHGKALNDFFIMPIVGGIIKSAQDFPAISVKEGDIGIIVNLYGSNLENCIVLFQNGESCGFSREEQFDMIKFTTLSNNRNIVNYKYVSDLALRKHYEQGFFNSVFCFWT